MYDLLIIGGGPAGLGAAIFGCRKHLNTALVEKTDAFGGHLWHSYGSKPVFDYPGFPEGILGRDLAQRLTEQARREGAHMHPGRTVTRVEKNDPGFRIYTAEGEIFDAVCLVVAMGTVPRRLGIPGEREFADRGVYYCFNSPHDFQGKRTVVVGGGNSALEVALGLRESAREVMLVHRSTFRADESLQHEFLRAQIPYLLGWVPESISGDSQGPEKLVIANPSTGERREVPLDALIVCAGLAPSAGYLEDLGLSFTSRGYVAVNQDQETNVPGVLAAGDITGGVARLSTAIGQGVTAAHTAHRYVRSRQGARTPG